MANELPEVIPIPAALIPNAEELSGEDLIFLLQDGYFKKLPATAFKGDAGDPATGLSVGGWKVATFKRVGETHRLNIIYRLIKSADELLWIEFAGTMDVTTNTGMVYSYQQETADEDLANVLCSTQNYLVPDLSSSLSARLAISISNSKISIFISLNGASGGLSQLLFSLDGILYNIRQALPVVPPPENASISIDQTQASVSNTSGTLSVTVETTGGGWFVEAVPTWLHVSQANGGNGQTTVTVSYDANTNTSGRNGTVKFTHADDSTLSATFTVTQAAVPVQKIVQVNFEKIAGTQDTDTVKVWLSTTDTILADVSVNVKVSSHSYEDERNVPLMIYGGQATSDIYSYQTYIISDSDWHITLNSYSPAQDDDGAFIEIMGTTE